MKYRGVISADIIGSTSIPSKERSKLLGLLKAFLKKTDKKFNTYSRITKGDLIEIYVDEAKYTLRIALLLKVFIKSKSSAISGEGNHGNNLFENRRSGYFKIHGIRMALAIDTMSKIDRKKGILEGEAIYATGRAINEIHTYNKDRIVIKNTIQFMSVNKLWEEEFDVLVSLLDILFSKITVRQSEILLHRLQGLSENLISAKLKISQSAINQSSKSVGWRAIEKSITHFENVIQ